MDEDDRYDEFGNLIGGSDGSESDSSVENSKKDGLQQNLSDISDSEDETDNSKQPQQTTTQGQLIQLNQDDNTSLTTSTSLQTGVTLAQRFGNEVETVVPQDIMSDEPVIAPEVHKNVKVEIGDNDLPTTSYSKEYMVNTARDVPERIRNLAIVGNLHSGKTSFVDLLVKQTHGLPSKSSLKFTDNHVLEIKRGMSIKTSAMSLLLPNSNGKSHIFNILDTPGHIGFKAEATVALDSCEGAIIVMDAVEGLSFRDKLLIDEIMSRNLPMTLIINKLDRLIVELKLPPADAYYKLSYMISEATRYVASNKYAEKFTHGSFSPLKNIIFASCTLNFCFSIQSFAELYYTAHGIGRDVTPFCSRLWGQYFYDTDTSKFVNSSGQGKHARSFVHFILEPLYKVITYTLTREGDNRVLQTLLGENFGIELTSKQLASDSQILLSEIFNQIFPVTAFVDQIAEAVPSPGISSIVSMGLVAKVIKTVESADGEYFYCMVKIIQGSAKVGQQVMTVSHQYHEDKDAVSSESIEAIYVSGGRYKIAVSELTVGSIGLVKGIKSIGKCGLLVGSDVDIDQWSSVITKLPQETVFKVAVEPKSPQDIDKLESSLRQVVKSYLSCEVMAQQAGEFVILGTGEIQMDCVLHDLRNIFQNNLQINVSEPMVQFCEGVTERSVTKITNEAAGVSMAVICEPLANDALSEAIAKNEIGWPQPTPQYAKILRTKYNVDSLESRTLWGFVNGKQPSVLVDDTIDTEIDPSVKEAIISGFQWAATEGPLCDEAVKGVKFKLLDLKIEGQTNSAQITPLTRRSCYTAVLTAGPKLLEPFYNVYITCNQRVGRFIEDMVNKRRGHVFNAEAIPGTPLVEIEGEMPVLDSFGFETDLRLATQGQAMCFFNFSKYVVVPGNPLDKDVYLPELKPVPTESMARDFVLKTRKRKGVTGDPTIQKYIDAGLYSKLETIGLV